MAHLVSCRTPLSFRDWRYLHRARLDILPLRGHSWFCSQEQDTSCRRCGKENETGFHVLNHCEEGLQLATKRHNTIQDLLESLLVKQGHDVTINIAFPGQRLRPDVEFQLSCSRGVWIMPTSGNMINVLRMGGFSPWLSGLWIMVPQERRNPFYSWNQRKILECLPIQGPISSDPGINGYVIFLNAPTPYIFYEKPRICLNPQAQASPSVCQSKHVVVEN
ncbi:hypothetical protein OUZ56_033908 [Daphnia magna]|uniref:Uncharacterized protein n=1 Tax=Daphnia magna TaxID=35525 RepID=A0ABR0BB98_9CRUS|nr:hypothetical protein OUZ56_033908 [Daphnia magna]